VIRILGVLVIVASFVLNIFLVVDKINTENKNYYTVTRVIDGDTFETDAGAQIRILGADAPEAGFCGASEAKSYLEKLILNKKVKISPTANDIFRRLVADVYSDGRSINNQMIASGWVAFDSSDSQNTKTMKESGENARKNKLGIYSEKCTQTIPPNKKCAIKANINDTFGDKIYYPANCGPRYDNVVVDLWRGDQWFCTESEAQKAGFVRAKVCG
jgi:endonuclease YncB( thermonuclease family)